VKKSGQIRIIKTNDNCTEEGGAKILLIMSSKVEFSTDRHYCHLQETDTVGDSK
jgi:hypothetical protein